LTEPELVDAEVNSLMKTEIMGSRLTRDERMQMLFINFMRCNPKVFATDCLEKLRQRFQQNGTETYYICIDGTKAIKTTHGL